MTFDLFTVFISCLILFIFCFVVFCIALSITTSPYPVITRSISEKQFYNPVDGRYIPFPNIDEPWSVNLSVIVPAYEEEDRLPPMLDECFDFLESRVKDKNKSGHVFSYEVIVVSDGSKDKTVPVAQRYTTTYGSLKCRVLELQPNRGKGGAVRLGMSSARGAVLLFADADGATKFSDLTKLENSLKELVKGDYQIEPERVSNELAIVCGSRAHLEKEAVATRSFFRVLLMHGAFDVEMLYIAQCLKIPISEVAVNWTEIEGSKIVPVWSWLQMGRDLFLIWLRYTIGAWRITKT
ncbi:dolichyl-phosphate beta-glucosyltransferase wollknaeuel isoform X2 [Lycorma delicatula]|uniref:dolichyl-phosphate beta-glucosyltransferase wollknaeuel isoform X2 n=1 Tax=Lycorma delicatula TaxID=130591 RepID=UPI003F5137D5